jgi:putative membrane protein
MVPIARRSLLLGAVVALPAVQAGRAFAFDVLPDARFVGYAQQVNDFEIGAGRLALAKSTNGNIRSFASRMITDYTDSAERLRKVRAEAGVSYAPDPNAQPHAAAILQRLNGLAGSEFDAAYANAQLTVLSDAEQQYAANSNSQSTNAGSATSGAMMRFARAEFPRVKLHREMAQALVSGR